MKIIDIMGQMGEQPRRGRKMEYPKEREICYLTRGRTSNEEPRECVIVMRIGNAHLKFLVAKKLL